MMLHQRMVDHRGYQIPSTVAVLGLVGSIQATRAMEGGMRRAGKSGGGCTGSREKLQRRIMEASSPCAFPQPCPLQWNEAWTP